MPGGNKRDTVIWLEIDRLIHDVTFVAAKGATTSGFRKQSVTDR
jgi:hypothetical protein